VTPVYIAPESWTSGQVDARADLFSLGVLFYEMLTGSPPRGAFRPPSEWHKNLDVRIDGVVFKALEPNPDERYQSAAELRGEVDDIRTSPPAGLPGTSPRRRQAKPSLLALFALILVIGTGLTAWLIQGRSELAGAVSSSSEGWISLLRYVDPETDAVRESGHGWRMVCKEPIQTGCLVHRC